MTINHYFIRAIILFFFSNASFAEPDNLDACIDNETIVINGLSLGDNAVQSFQKLGDAIKVEKGNSEDDGGEFLVTKYTFQNLIVEISRDEVSLIQVFNDKISAPYGLKVGAHLSMIEKLSGIHIMHNANRTNPVYIGICPGETTFIAIYHNNLIVTGYKVFQEGP